MLHQKVTVSTSILVQELEDEIVILNLNNETYYRLDGTAARIWQLLGTCGSIDGVIDVMSQEYQVPTVDLQHDVETITAEFVELDLLHLAENNTSAPAQD
jgi:hypothetical protein